MLLEDPAAVGMAPVLPDINLEILPLQPMGPVPEIPVAEAQIPLEGLLELSNGATWEGQAFWDPGKARVLFPFFDF